MFDRIAIGWQIGVPSGWGTYGVNLATQLALKGVTPTLFFVAQRPTLTADQGAILGPALAEHPHWAAAARPPAEFDFPILHALGDKLDWPEMLSGLRGRPDIGVVFFESAVIPPQALAQADRLALIVTGSSWNADVLQRHGFARVANCPQGVDLALFAPGPRTARFAGRFAVFSGGKLEYRKGQDLVVAAFKRFHQRRPEALLVTAWHNPWPAAAQSLAMSSHVAGAPQMGARGRLDIAGWLQANGLPETSFIDLGPLTNAETPPLLRDVDLAVFPNRCEGGTNLVAMECMASGVPVVLSRNTGHLDLIGAGNCYVLEMQIPMGAVTGHADLDGWGESSIDELSHAMEMAFSNPADARGRAAAGAATMQTWDWSTQVDRFLAAVSTVG